MQRRKLLWNMRFVPDEKLSYGKNYVQNKTNEINMQSVNVKFHAGMIVYTFCATGHVKQSIKNTLTGVINWIEKLMQNVCLEFYISISASVTLATGRRQILHSQIAKQNRIMLLYRSLTCSSYTTCVFVPNCPFDKSLQSCAKTHFLQRVTIQKYISPTTHRCIILPLRPRAPSPSTTPGLLHHKLFFSHSTQQTVRFGGVRGMPPSGRYLAGANTLSSLFASTRVKNNTARIRSTTSYLHHHHHPPSSTSEVAAVSAEEE